MPQTPVRRSLLAFAALSCALTALAWTSRPGGPLGPTVDEMAGAASHLLSTLSPELRARCGLEFSTAERETWHFIPGDRAGVRFSEMDDAGRAAARALLRSALSSQGALKLQTIMSLDGVLRDMERAAGRDGAARDPLGYDIVVFGDPRRAPWGWKIEGHHISLNFTCAAPDSVSVTPSFLGANPAEVKSGPLAGLRAMAAEEDLGRALVASLDESQRKDAIISDHAPADVLTLPGRPLDDATAAPLGLAASRMNPQQLAILASLVDEYANNLRRELARAELSRIAASGVENIRFAWAGPLTPGQGHYYRIVGPTFIIEYDNTQNDANHIHTVWHDRTRNFARDALKDHYQHSHHAP